MALLHGNKPIGGCFALTTGQASAQALTVAAAALSANTGAGSDTPTARMLTSFLNVIAPGHAALVSAVGRLDASAYSVDPAYWPEAGSDDDPVPGVTFAPTFFTAGTLERVLVLASHQLGHAATSSEFRNAESPILTPARLATLDAFTALAARSGRAPTRRQVAAWAPENRSKNFLDELQFLLTLEPPDGADAIAQWLTEAHSLRGAPVAMA